jgi:hypothetical protein
MGRFLMEKNVSGFIKSKIESAKKGLGGQYNNTKMCQSFYNGNMMDYTDTVQFNSVNGKKKKATVKFNKIQPHVDAMAGFMAQNRRRAKFVARINSSDAQELYSKNMNAIYEYHRENMNADQIESMQDEDMLICGYGATETDLSYIIGNSTTTPNGEILKMRIDPMRVGWDCKAKGKNLTDAKYVYYFQDYDLSDALDLFDKSKPEDFERVAETETEGGYTFNPYGGVYDKIKMEDSVEWVDKEKETVRVYNFQYFKYEKFYMSKNPLYLVEDPMDAMFIQSRLEMIKDEIKSYSPTGINAGDIFDFDPMAEEFTFDEATKNKLVAEFGDLIEPIGFTRKCYYTAIVSGSHVFNHFKSVCQQGFSIKFKTGSYSEDNKIFVGMVNAMIEPQKYYNKAITEFMFIVASMSKGGVMVEKSAVEDVKDFENKWAKTDGIIYVEDGALTNGKIKEKQQAMLPNGVDSIISLTDSSILSNGVDQSFLGASNAQETGVLYKRKIRQVISKMAKYFDAVTLYQKLDARLNADLIRVWVQNNEGALIRLTGSDGVEGFKQISEDMLAPEYDVVIQEAAKTPEDNQETAEILGAYGDKLSLSNPQAAQTFYLESLNMLNIDGDIKNRLAKALQPQEEETVPMAQFMQLQARIQELEGEQAQADLRKKLSDAALNEAKVASENVKQVDTLESARNKSLENDLIRNEQYNKVHITI